jgi:hypothetical protein
MTRCLFRRGRKQAMIIVWFQGVTAAKNRRRAPAAT